jgi:hypothetical protein
VRAALGQGDDGGEWHRHHPLAPIRLKRRATCRSCVTGGRQ